LKNVYRANLVELIGKEVEQQELPPVREPTPMTQPKLINFLMYITYSFYLAWFIASLIFFPVGFINLMGFALFLLFFLIPFFILSSMWTCEANKEKGAGGDGQKRKLRKELRELRQKRKLRKVMARSLRRECRRCSATASAN